MNIRTYLYNNYVLFSESTLGSFFLSEVKFARGGHHVAKPGVLGMITRTRAESGLK